MFSNHSRIQPSRPPVLAAAKACLGSNDASNLAFCMLLDPSTVALQVVAVTGGETITLLRNVNTILVA
jgi:hypothetical protein